jgi:hypothetical protein
LININADKTAVEYTMRARSIELYLLPSLTDVIDNDPFVLIDSNGRRATLTKSFEEAALHIRRGFACGALIARSLMGGGSNGLPARRRFDEIFSRTKIQSALPDDGTVLVIDCHTEFHDQALQHVIDL